MKFSIDNASFRNQLKREKTHLLIRTRQLADLIAREIVKNALTKTSETKDGVNRGDGPRYTYRGGWADVTTQLAKSIQGRVEQDGLIVRAVIEATVEYAEALNEKEGYEVLGGAEIAAKLAIAKYAKDLFG